MTSSLPVYIDLDRLERALTLFVTETAPGHYTVDGGDQLHNILRERDHALRRLAALRPRLSKGLRRQLHEQLGTPDIRLVPGEDPEIANIIDGESGEVVAHARRKPGPVHIELAAA